MKPILITYIFLFISLAVQAQKWCGTHASSLTTAERQAALTFYQKSLTVNYHSRSIDSVAVTVHIVNNGKNKISFRDVEAQIANMNLTFREVGIAFFLCGSIRMIDGLNTYGISEGEILNITERIPNTINIYIVEDFRLPGDVPILGFSKFPFNEGPARSKVEERYIMMNQIAWNDGSTLIHEMGHFYGLWHTHETFYGFEYVDGSNCQTAGDLICDTPADPDLSKSGAVSDCSYTGIYTDHKGQAYSPSVSNYMSYAPSQCHSSFSPKQLAIIKAIHENENAYLISRCNFYPDFSVKSNVSSLKIRSDENINIVYDFEVEDHEKDYEVVFRVMLKDFHGSSPILYEENIQINEGQNSFSKSLELEFPMTKGSATYILEATLDADFQVVELTERNNFVNTELEVDNSGMGDLLLFPTPAEDEVTIFMRNKYASGDLSMKIYTYDGRFIQEKKDRKNQEEFLRILDISELNRGIYLLKFEFEKGDRVYAVKFRKM